MPGKHSPTAALALALSCALAAPLAADWQAGVQAFKSGDFAAAAEAFAAEAAKRPEWHGAHLMLGRTLMRQGRSEEGIASLRQAHRLEPADTNASLFLARAAAGMQLWAEADLALSGVEAGELAKKERLAFHGIRAQAAIDRGDATGAISHLRQSARLNPGDAEVHFLLATTALDAGQTDLGVDHLWRARRADPHHVAAASRLTQALFNRTLGLSGEDLVRACAVAAGEADHLVELDGSFQHLLLAGRLALCAGDTARSELLLTRAVAAGRDWQGHYYLARARALLGRWQDAEQTLRPAFASHLEPDQRRKVHALMGFIYEGQQRFEQAIDQYRKAEDPGRVAKARESLEIQRHNEEVEALRKKAAELGIALEDLEQQERELGRGGF